MEGRLSQSYQVYAKRNTAYYERLIKEYASDGGTLKIYKKEGAVTDIKIAAEAEEVDGEKPKIMIRIHRCQTDADVFETQNIYGNMFYGDRSGYQRK